MHQECRHVYPAGFKCTVDQLQDSHFCYFHRNFEQRLYAPPTRPGTPFRMPSLEDAHGCLTGIQEVTWALGEKRITQKESGTYLYAVNLAMRLLPRIRSVSRKPVRALNYDSCGTELAEPVRTCDPPHDCLTCEKHCPWFAYYKPQVEELVEEIEEEREQEEQEQKELAAQQQGENAAASDQQQPAENSSESASHHQPAKITSAATAKAIARPVSAERPGNGKYDNELPMVRALLLDMDRKAERDQILRQEREAQIEANKRIFDNIPRPKAS
jgi:hypothetical protein